MFSVDFLVFVIATVQPIFIGYFAVLGLKRLVASDQLLGLVGGLRSSSQASRLYECGSYPRLASLFSFDVNSLLLCAALVIYDADLLFILTEGVVALTSGLFELMLVAFLLFLFVVGVLFDSKEGGMDWSFI